MELPKKDLIIWEKYNQIRISGDKKTATKILNDFIASVKQNDYNTIKDFVNQICEIVLENNNSIIFNNGTFASNQSVRIQHQLFTEIILPILIDEFKNNSAKHIKWIGQLEQFFHSDNRARTKLNSELNLDYNFTTKHFFEKSYLIDKNQITLNLLLNSISQEISFDIHELPIGVLANPEEFEQEINYFKKYFECSENKSFWEKSLTRWENISKHWTFYFENKNNSQNFQNYLEQNQIKL